jgi:hypothetical protein
VYNEDGYVTLPKGGGLSKKIMQERTQHEKWKPEGKEHSDT